MIFSPQRKELTDSLNVARFLDGDVKNDLASYIENAVVSFKQRWFPDTLVNILYRLGICQKIYTTQFSGEKILHTENA